MLSGKKYSPRFLLQYIKEFSKSDKLRAFIVPKTTDLITLVDNNGNMLSIQEDTFMESIVIQK